MKTNKT